MTTLQHLTVCTVYAPLPCRGRHFPLDIIFLFFYNLKIISHSSFFPTTLPRTTLSHTHPTLCPFALYVFKLDKNQEEIKSQHEDGSCIYNPTPSHRTTVNFQLLGVRETVLSKSVDLAKQLIHQQKTTHPTIFGQYKLVFEDYKTKTKPNKQTISRILKTGKEKKEDYPRMIFSPWS